MNGQASKWQGAGVALICGSLILLISLGVRHAFGLFLQPVSMDQGWGRETFAFAIALLLFSGCAEGPLSRFGALNPWVRQKWAEEDRIVQSLPSRRAQLQDLAQRAGEMPPAEQERVAQDLIALLRDDPVTIVRVDAVRALAALSTNSASATFSLSMCWSR